MQIKFAEKCAWRAFYVYIGKDGNIPILRFAMGIDPRGNRAQLFIVTGFCKDCTGGRKGTRSWRTELPRWKHWWRIDGRR